MRRRSSADGEPTKAQRRKTAARKRRIAPKGVRRRGSSAAGEETAVARLTRERDEALEQQAATAEVLKALSRSTFDLQSVLKSLLENAVRLCGAEMGLIYRQDGDIYRVAASFGHSNEFLEKMKQSPIHQDRSSATGRAVLERRVVHIPDTLADADYRWGVNIRSEKEMHRTILAVPMLKGDAIIGVIVIRRTQVKPFTDKQIAMLSNFADQAVVAIENARLVSELHESLRQQTSTADVLKIISRSAFDLQPVLEALIESATRLCGATRGHVFQFDGEYLRFAAAYGAWSGFAEHLESHPLRPGPGSIAGRAASERRTIHSYDVLKETDYELIDLIKQQGYRTVLAVPMLREGVLRGVITILKTNVEPFTDKQIEMVETFADQAVIAIENVRLFEAEQQRTRELSESLAQQTATSEVLRVISSSPGDLGPVFQAMLDNATRICEAKFGNLFLNDDGAFRAVAWHGEPTYVEVWSRQSSIIISDDPRVPLARLAKTKRPIHVADLRAEPAYKTGFAPLVTLVDRGGARTLLIVPMLKEHTLVGAIAIYRQEVRPFSDKQIALLSNFAAQAVIAIENTRLLNELRQRTTDLAESLEQQTATSEVLQVISSSPGDVQPVFETMLESAVRICDAKFGNIYRWDGDALHLAATHNTPPAFAEARKLSPGDLTGRSATTKTVVHIADAAAEPAYVERNPTMVATVELGGVRTFLAVPMLQENELIGVFSLARQEVRPFTDKEIALVTSFAAQAVIAIENTRLLNELRQRTDDLTERTEDLTEALEQQTATSEVLRVISRSPGDLKPVFQTMLENATRICEARFGTLFRFDGKSVYPAADVGTPPELSEYVGRPAFQPRPGGHLDRVLRTKQLFHTADDTAEAVPGSAARLAGARSTLCVPMLKDDALIGAIVIYRQEVRPFTDKQIELLTNFAAQAAIAIENTRLLNELRESLQQQTSTADVLKVISRSTFDLPAVLNTLTESAARLCVADKGVILLRDGDVYRLVANYGYSPEALQYAAEHPVQPDHGSMTGRVALEGRAIHIRDVLADPEYRATGYQQAFGYRTALGVPLLREGATIGVFFLSRDEVNPFTEKQIGLVTTFADQALIAIENVRLFEAEQQRSRELSESLEQQTATSEVLRVISSSPGDLQPVFGAMLENAVRICDAKFGNIYRLDGDALHIIASHNTPTAFAEQRRSEPFRPGPKNPVGQMIATKTVVHFPDVSALEAYIERDPVTVEAVEVAGIRTFLAVPMLKENELIGAFTLLRQEVRPFTDKQIELVQNFAAQAVIAIENTRLLIELRRRTDELAQRQAELSVTFDNMGDGVVMFNEELRLAAWNRNLQEILDLPDSFFAEPRTYRDYMTYLIEHGEFGDVDLETELRRYIDSADRQRRVERTRPDGRVLEIRVNPVPGGGFVAIYSDVTERKKAEERVRAARDAAESALRELKSAQDRLVQTEKLASLGQLTAGIAHEIKNPLNFVNNFSAVSVELIDELREALGGIHLDTKQRAEISEIADMLQGNLDKVVQHGKRADSIVKNMLLHSRAGSGEHRLVDINALVDESLNLAYHGARAEKQGFTITLERSFDPAAGELALFPQDITRVLLNLISNGFYAAMKRQAEADGGDFEPTLSAATKNLGDRVEIRIRDNGTGIPPEVKEKMFNPFFTTKPAGEGTGLGLSISHDIIVKQHGGSMEVDTQPGSFTEFRIVLPRAGASLIKSGERA